MISLTGTHISKIPRGDKISKNIASPDVSKFCHLPRWIWAMFESMILPELNSLNIKYHSFCRKDRVKTQMELVMVMAQKIWELWVLKLKKCALTPPSSMALCSCFFLVYLSSLGTALVFRQDYSSESKQSSPQARQKMNSIQMEAIDIASNAMILNIWGIG